MRVAEAWKPAPPGEAILSLHILCPWCNLLPHFPLLFALVPLAAELNTGKAEAPPPTPKYGTKLESLVKHLLDLRKEDATAKVILFVQFDDLKRKVADALEDSGVPTVLLHGTTSMRSNIVRDWQESLP